MTLPQPQSPSEGAAQLFFGGLSESSRSTERRTAFGVAQVRGPSRLQNEIIRHSFSLARAISAIGLRGVSYPS